MDDKTQKAYDIEVKRIQQELASVGKRVFGLPAHNKRLLLQEISIAKRGQERLDAIELGQNILPKKEREKINA